MILRLTQVSKAILLSCIVLFLTTTSFAQTTTYTAVANGNYTSAATWQGGIIPPVTTGLVSFTEHIVIPQGITVTLDTNLHLKTSGWNPRMTVNGSLIGLPGYYARIQAPLLSSATGVVNIDSTSLQGIYAGIDFNGTMTTNNCYMSNYTFKGTLNIKKVLHMHNASDVNQVSGTLNFSNHCWIKSEGRCRFYTVSNGVVNYADTMNLSYKYLWLGGTNFDLDIDTNYIGRQIDSLIIDLDTNYSAPAKTWGLRVAHKDLYFNGVMIIKSGNLRQNHHKITFGPNAKLYCTPNKGRIEVDKDADIVVNATSDFGDGFIFWDETILTYPKDTIRNFTLNMGSSTGVVKLQNGMTVAGTLDLKKGQLHIGKSQLRMQSGSSATITNAGPNSYVTSEITGALHMDVPASGGTRMFPVGTPSNYAPVSVKNNSSASDIFKANVVDYILDSVTKGLSVSNGEPVVAATWVVDNTAISGANADITLMWPTAMEVNSFDRTNSYITRFDHNAQEWDTQPSPSAATLSGSFYTHTESTTSFDAFNDDYFAVFDSHTSLANLSVNNVTANNKITLYPNPTSDNATIGMTLENSQTISVTLTDVSGRVVYSKPATQYTSGKHTIALPTQTLTSGLYFVQLTNKNGTVLNSGKLLKQ